MKIAFCDDDPFVLNELEKLLNEYCLEHNCEVDYGKFSSPLNLLAEIEKGIRYDALFLDVLMPGENGIETAEEIRNYDRNVKIIFLSSSSEFGVESYKVSAYYYQLKPVKKDSFFRLMDSLFSQCGKEQSNSIVLRCKSGITRIELTKLEYCEVIHRTLSFHMTTGNVLKSIGSLEELCKQLEPYDNFFRLHRSYLVNLEYVQSISYRAVTMSNLAEIPIPRGKYNEVKNAFLEYVFRNRQMMK